MIQFVTGTGNGSTVRCSKPPTLEDKKSWWWLVRFMSDYDGLFCFNDPTTLHEFSRFQSGFDGDGEQQQHGGGQQQ